jgi:hypothetical protein
LSTRVAKQAQQLTLILSTFNLISLFSVIIIILIIIKNDSNYNTDYGHDNDNLFKSSSLFIEYLLVYVFENPSLFLAAIVSNLSDQT